MSQSFTITEEDKRFMQMACDLACENVECGGGPFGAVIVKDGDVIAAAGNSVTLDNDPTAHAEVNAIRRACSLLDSFKLDGCVIYCSSEPCPMCLGALYFAGVSRIYYGSSTAEADRFYFGSLAIDREFEKPHLERSIPCIHIEATNALDAFKKWADKKGKVE